MDLKKISDHITNWLISYCDKSGLSGFIVGISGGVDSALTSLLCANTNKKVIVLSMPIRQTKSEFERANEHIRYLKSNYSNVESIEVNLTNSFSQIESDFPENIVENHLAMANTRSRLRMLTLYAIGQVNNCLVIGTGNKVEDFGIGFFTKYGDGGVDLSPIADLNKTQVFSLAKHLGVINSILDAKPTDGLFEDGRSDEDQIGASYPELEWAMNFNGERSLLNDRQVKVLEIYDRLHQINQHKMLPIPICLIPQEFF